MDYECTFAQNVYPIAFAAANRFRSGIQMATIIYAQTFANSFESVNVKKSVNLWQAAKAFSLTDSESTE